MDFPDALAATSNIVNAGLVAVDNDEVFYAQADTGGIYRMSSDGSDRLKLTSDFAKFINVYETERDR